MRNKRARHRGQVRARAVVALVVIGIVGLQGTPASAAIVPEKVIGGPGDQYEPHANLSYVTWSSNSTGRPHHWDAFARSLLGADVVRLNAAGTQGQTGGLEPGTNRVIYQQWRSGSSNLYFYDIDTSSRQKVPDVNTSSWEWGPRVSTEFVLFLRYARHHGRWFEDLYLFSRSSGSLRRIGSWLEDSNFLYTGGVGDRYASWTRCSPRCSAYVYDSVTRAIKRVPAPSGRQQYAPVVDELHGEVYFTRSGAKCGQGVSVWHVPVTSLGATPTIVGSLPSGIDTGWTLSLAENTVTAKIDLYFERWRCGAETGDIYTFRGVADST